MTTEENEFGFDNLKLPFSKTEWVDADERIFEACFTILGQFVENELGLCKKTNSPDQHLGYRLHSEGETDITAIDLWVWYKEYYNNIQNDVDKDYTLSYIKVPQSDKSSVFSGMLDVKNYHKKYDDNDIHKLKNEKLSKIMEIRSELWI